MCVRACVRVPVWVCACTFYILSLLSCLLPARVSNPKYAMVAANSSIRLFRECSFCDDLYESKPIHTNKVFGDVSRNHNARRLARFDKIPYTNSDGVITPTW